MMALARKVIGFLIIILMAMPTLFGMIWAYGVVQSVLTPDVIVKIPQRVIVNAPMIADEMVASASKSAELNANDRRWAMAVASVSTKPSQVMADSGLTKWLDQEVSPALVSLGRAMEGKNNGKSITINLEPFKAAVRSDEAKKYLNAVLANLPTCSETESAKWEEIMNSKDSKDDLPACRPSDSVLERVMLSANEELEKMPSEEIIFDANLANTNLRDLVKKILATMMFIPAAMFLIGGLLMSFSKQQFFKVVGISVLITGLASLGIAALADNAVSLAPLVPTAASKVDLSPKMVEFVSQDIFPLILPILGGLFDPVITTSVVVIAIGLIFFGISFFLNTTSYVRAEPTKLSEVKTKKVSHEKKSKN